MTKEVVSKRFQELQSFIVDELTKIDGSGVFISDSWTRDLGGGGVTKIMANGTVIEKGGVAFSEVHGDVTEVMKKQLALEGTSFFACGVSIVLHANHPYIPIIHMNVRYFELDNGTYWFGGGIDLTPHYIEDSCASRFHKGLKKICDHYHTSLYPRFKEQADDYFFIPHRNETRGIGGIFFDHEQENNEMTKSQWFDLCTDLCKNFPILYQEQVEFGKEKPIDETNIAWRNHRRGRYVEFNLVHDRGTKFGLLSGGRTESILMSLPPLAQWTYCFDLKENSEENSTQNKLVKGYEWANVN